MFNPNGSLAQTTSVAVVLYCVTQHMVKPPLPYQLYLVIHHLRCSTTSWLIKDHTITLPTLFWNQERPAFSFYMLQPGLYQQVVQILSFHCIIHGKVVCNNNKKLSYISNLLGIKRNSYISDGSSYCSDIGVSSKNILDL